MRLNAFFTKNCWALICFFPACTLLGQAVAVEAEKMNVLVVGVDNPLTIVVSDLYDSCLVAIPSVGKITKGWGSGKYLWSGVSDTTVVSMTLRDTCSQSLVAQRSYRVRTIPIQILLGANPKYRHNKALGVGEFKAQSGIAAVISGMDICGNCDMAGFYARFFSHKTGEIWIGYNTGARFMGDVLKHQQAVVPGDWVKFEGFSYRCPGMKTPAYDDDVLHFQIK